MRPRHRRNAFRFRREKRAAGPTPFLGEARKSRKERRERGGHPETNQGSVWLGPKACQCAGVASAGEPKTTCGEVSDRKTRNRPPRSPNREEKPIRQKVEGGSPPSCLRSYPESGEDVRS